MKLSLICPCYNEEKNILPFVDSVAETFKDLKDYEIILINDGSTDETLRQMKKAGEEYSCNIKIINLSRNFGKEAAMYAGMEHCCGDLITIIDSDLQQDPEIAKKMVDILEARPEFDCVCAYQEARIENGFKRLCKKAFYKIANSATDIEFHDGASDFRTFRSYVKDAILSLGETNRFSKGIFSWVGFSTKYIPYIARERQNGKSSFNFFKLFRYAVNGIISFSTAPLKLAGIVGSTAIFFSIIYSVITVIRKLVDNINVDGFTQLVILIAFLGGIQLFSVGIIGEYLAKNYIETKKRPVYIAKEIIDYDNKSIDI